MMEVQAALAPARATPRHCRSRHYRRHIFQVHIYPVSRTQLDLMCQRVQRPTVGRKARPVSMDSIIARFHIPTRY